MDNLVIYFVMFSLFIGLLSSLKLCFNKSTANVLIGEGLVAIIAVTLLVCLSYLGVSFAETVALFIVVAGPIGTMAFSKVLRKHTKIVE